MSSVNNTELMTQMLDYAIAWSPALLAYLLLRTAAVRTALYFMMKKGKQTLIAPDEIERGSLHSIALNTLMLDSSFNITPSEKPSYKRWVKAMKSGLSSWWSFVRAIGIFIIVVALLLYYSTQHFNAATASFYQVLLAGLLPIVLFSSVSIILIISASRTYILGYLPFIGGFISLVILSLIALSIAPIYNQNWFVCALPAFFCMAYFIKSHRNRFVSERKDGNHRLLILRVFDADRNTAFTFGELSHFWRFIGSTITIVDPSYLRFRYSLAYPRNKLRIARILFLMAIFLSLLSMLLGIVDYILPSSKLVGNLSHETRVELLGVMAWLVLIPLALIPIFIAIKRRFISSEVDLENSLTMVNEDNVSNDGVYEDISLYCHSNAWKPAINSLVAKASVILMDLRGLTPERAGSLYELDLVANRFSLKNIVFLINDEVEKQQLETLLRERIEVATSDSPNKIVDPINVMIYQPGRYDIGDNKRILAMLVAATASPEKLNVEKINFGAWQKFKLLMEKPAQIWRVLSEQIDMAISRPPLAYGVIPVLLTMVLVMFIYRVSPLLDAWEIDTNLPSPAVTEVIAKAKREIEPSGKVPLQKASKNNENYAFYNWSQLSVRLDIYGENMDKALEMGMVNVHRAEADNKRIRVKKVDAGIFSSNMLENIISVSRGMMTTVSARNGNTTVEHNPLHPKGAIRISLHFDAPKSLSKVDIIEGDILLKLQDPELLTRIDLPVFDHLKKQSFTFPGLESYGVFEYHVNNQYKQVIFEYSKALPKGVEFFLIEPSGKRRQFMKTGSYTIGSGADKKFHKANYSSRLSKEYFSDASKQYIGFEIVRVGKMLEVRVPFKATNIMIKQK